ncbi:MAG: YdcF family protein [Betaproteobacteria bacterium]|nr:YdcF family protein [Betaproteobacteria bacterium]
MELLARLVELPALFAAGLVALAILARKARSRPVLAMAVALLFAWLGVATPYGASLWVGMLEDRVVAPKACEPMPPGALVIVLAGGVAEGTGASDPTRLSAASLRRVLAAAQVAKRSPESPLVLSGGAGESVREADLMRALLIDLGVSPGRLAIERESRNTFENATAVARIVAERGWRSRPAYLLTSAMHLPRAAAVFRKAGIDTCPLAADRRLEPLDPRIAWIPSGPALLNAFQAFHEFIGLLAYAVTGRL